MTGKRIKQEQWSVRELIFKINNQEIYKPKFQRKRKWVGLEGGEVDIGTGLSQKHSLGGHILTENDNTPNVKAYIQFLFNTENSVHALTFGQETNSHKTRYSNIDGNNRINAIKLFIDFPLVIFKEYLNDLNILISNIDLIQEDKDNLKDIFSKLSYNEIINFKYNSYFNKNEYKNLYTKIKIYRDEFENVIEKIQIKLKLNNSENFDSNVKISVCLFEGYNTDELCKTFEDINKYNNKLTEIELLASRLYNEVNFNITDNIFKTELEACINEYYMCKADGEVLTCYYYDSSSDRMNAHDFIVGFQTLCNKKYNFIDKSDVDGVSLFFKLYKLLYSGYANSFTSEYINDFKEKIFYSCNILNETLSSIFTSKITDKLFHNSCQAKMQTLKKNTLYMLLSCIIGYKNKNTSASIIKKSLEKCLLYHFMVSDLKNKDKREFFRNYDSITYKAGGGFIDNESKNLLSIPEKISNRTTEEEFNNLISQLFLEVNNPYKRKLDNGKNRNDKRRNLKFFEKTLMFYYYKERIPTNMLENDFSIEHIFPNSSEWDGEIDKDRTGNLIPIISKMNTLRSNKHINVYNKDSDSKAFCKFINDIIPRNDIYNAIISHERKPTIINNELYNNRCAENEENYKQNLLTCLFNSR